MPLLQTSGNDTADAYAGGVAVIPNYIESVFSTYLYTGVNSAQTVNTGIDLSTYGGMLWIKNRSSAWNHYIADTARGSLNYLSSNTTTASTASTDGVTSFNTNGFTTSTGSLTNRDATNIVSWTFRKQPKFFDVVTWSGNDGTGWAINHALGSVPGCIIVKKTTGGTQDWKVWHRAVNSGNSAGTLNSTAAFVNTDGKNFFGDGSSYIAPTSTQFTVTDILNASGSTYVAYLFAHDAGGFGLTGTDNVISCGNYVGTATVTLGYEPQFLMVKKADGTGNWVMLDNMRGAATGGPSVFLAANANYAEGNANLPSSSSNFIDFNATGFTVNVNNGNVGSAGSTYIYIAIRRGPMKVPTDATKVFAPVTYTGNGATQRIITTGILTDMILGSQRSTGFAGNLNDRLRGPAELRTPLTNAEGASSVYPLFDNMSGYNNNGATGSNYNSNGTNYVRWAFGRAPGFFDEVCYIGSGSPTTRNHNLTVIPELVIIKSRSGAGNWSVASKVNATEYARSLPGTASPFTLNSDNASSQNVDLITGGQMAATTFVPYVLYGTSNDSEQSGVTYVAYLFATCAGVSKVGKYSGTGATQTISCGFTGGARFVLIKSIDIAANWFVWDTARGMVAGTDPRLALNTTAAESNANWVYTTTGGFQIVSTAADINASGGTYIYLAIA